MSINYIFGFIIDFRVDVKPPFVANFIHHMFFSLLFLFPEVNYLKYCFSVSFPSLPFTVFPCYSFFLPLLPFPNAKLIPTT